MVKNYSGLLGTHSAEQIFRITENKGRVADVIGNTEGPDTVLKEKEERQNGKSIQEGQVIKYCLNKLSGTKQRKEGSKTTKRKHGQVAEDGGECPTV